jgi:D-alanyl-D-alanine carboxypeptidase (penicillin-binding protein 5/6)
VKHFISIVLFSWALSTGTAQAQMPQAPAVAAKAYLLLDLTANQLLAAKDPDMAIEPASLTKLMTAYLVFDALKSGKISLNETFHVSERASKMAGSRMFIDPKMKVPVEDLLKGMVVQSGNDATMALAEGVGGSAERFVQMMNDQAKVLGMKKTQYLNPEGLAAVGHSTSVRDLSILATHLIHDFPAYMPYFAIKKYRYPGTPAANESNRNLLLFRDLTVDGLATGHTQSAGYNMVATAKRELPNVGTRRLLAIVVGVDSDNARANESQKLLNWGYTAFDAVKLFDANQAVATPPVWKGKSNELKLGSFQPLVVAVPAGSVSQLKTQLVRPDPLVAPYGKGQAVGALKVLRGDQPLLDVPLFVLEGVDQAGVLGRAWDALRLWIK